MSQSACCTGEGFTVLGQEEKGKVVALSSTDTNASPLLRSYVTGGILTDTVVIILPDIFGFATPEVRTYADQLSVCLGCLVHVPDIFGPKNASDTALNAPDDSWLPSWLEPVMDPTRSFGEKSLATLKLITHTPSLIIWSMRHTEAKCGLRIQHCVSSIVEQEKAQRLLFVGFCWGARYVIRMAAGQRYLNDYSMICGVAHHPGGLSLPDDVANTSGKSDSPVLIQLARGDSLCSPSSVEIINKYAPQHQVNWYDNVVHGFSIRGHPSDPVTVAAKQLAFSRTVDYLKSFMTKSSL